MPAPVRVRFAGVLTVAGLVGLIFIVLLRNSFRPFGFMMNLLLLLVVAIGAIFLLRLWKRPGFGPAADNTDVLLESAKVKLEHGEISEDEYKQIKDNVKD